MSESLDFTVGVVTYERSEWIGDLFESLADQTRVPEEILVVDDSEDDATERVVERAADQFADDTDFEYRHRDADRGIPSARNELVEWASGDVVCFVDDDAVCGPEWLASIAETYESDPDAVAVGGPAVLSDADLEPTVEVSRTDERRNSMNKYGEVDLCSDFWVPPRPMEVDTLIGANMSFRRETIRRIGGFRTDYEGTAAFEETDVFARLWDEDATVVYHPDAFVYHRQVDDGGSRTSIEDRRGYYYWLGRNLINFRWRNFRSTFPVSLARLLVRSPNTRSVASQLRAAMRDPTYLSYSRGFLDGLRYDVFGGKKA